VAKKTTKKPRENNLMQGGYYSVVAENMTKTKKHAQFSIISEKIVQSETDKPTPKRKRTKDI